MARNIQIREPGNNYADVLHPETNSGMVLMANGKTLQAEMGKIKIIEFFPESGTIDLNTLTEPCLYRFAGSVPVLNGPYEIMGDQTMLVTGGVMSFQITISRDGEIAYRNSSWNGSFGPWYKSIHRIYNVTLDTTWTGTSAPFTKTQTVTGILATDTPIVDVVMSGTYATDEARQEAWSNIYRITTANNSITLYAKEKPTVNLPIQLKVVR